VEVEEIIWRRYRVDTADDILEDKWIWKTGLLMAKVTLVFTRPGKEYEQRTADALIRDLDGLIEKLNSTFQQDLREEQQRFAWFNGRYGGC
jgi:hypothetical protein